MASTSKSVLIVDPQDEVRAFCRALLSSEGFEVREGRVRADVHEALQTTAVDLILIGIFLEDGPAYRLFEEALLGDIAVIGLLDVFQGPTVGELLRERYSFLALLEKPVSGANLIDMLRGFFGDTYPEPPELLLDHGERRALRDSFERRKKDTGTWPRAHHHGPARKGTTDVGVRPLAESSTPPPVSTTEAPQDTSGRFKRVRTSPRHAVSKVGDWLPEGLDWRDVEETGRLSEVSFAALLARVHHTRFTGLLKLWREHVRKVVHFVDGVPVAAHSNLIYEYLGQVLTREKVIDELEAQRAMEQAKAENKRLGAVLVESGLLSKELLTEALSLQMQTRLLDIFSWSDAEYILDAKSEPMQSVVLDSTQYLQLIVKGVLEVLHQARVLRDLERCLKQNLKPRYEIERFHELDLNMEQEAIVDEIFDGGTLLELVAQFEQSAHASRFVYALAALGYVVFTRSGKP